LAWKEREPLEATTEYIVLLSSLPLRSSSVPGFLRDTMRIRAQLAETPGLVGYALNAELTKKRFRTMSAWRTEDDLDAFARTEPHHGIMRRLSPSMDAALRAARTHADEIEPVTLCLETGAACNLARGVADRLFDGRRRRHVDHRATTRADQVMVVFREVFDELVVSEVAACYDAMHDADLLEHRQVSVHGRDRQRRARRDDVGNRQGLALGARQDLEQRFAVRREPLIRSPEQRPDRVPELVREGLHAHELMVRHDGGNRE
jgi:heme-degrading monooxygenase HmoA